MSICSMHLLLGGARAHGVAERVEVGDDQVERLDAQVTQLSHVVGVAGVSQDPGVDGGMQGLDPAVKALGEPGEVLDLGHRHAGVGDPRGSGTR